MTKDCSNCFFKELKGKDHVPCPTCRVYDKWVADSAYFWKENTLDEYSVREDIMKELDNAVAAARVTGEYDPVDKPKHYMLFEEEGIEVRDVIKVLLNRMVNSEEYNFEPMDYADYAQMMQYLMRFMDKNGKEDCLKARWYLDKLIEGWEG